MGLLTGPEIVRVHNEGLIDVDPWVDARVNPNSVNVLIGSDLLVYKANLNYLNWLNAQLAMTFGPSCTVFDRTVSGYVDHDSWRIPDECVLDPCVENETVPLTIPAAGLVLVPGVMYLGATEARIRADYPYCPMIEGRSSSGRLGIVSHQTAGFGDVSFNGTFTLEITVTSPVRVYPGLEMCQVAFHRVEGDAQRYTGTYAARSGPVAAKPFHVRPK